MAFKKRNTPRFVVTGSPRAMKIKPHTVLRKHGFYYILYHALFVINTVHTVQV
jgi:hypothetical protein